MFETSWQDIVLTIGNLVFFVALLPSIFSTNKPSRWTSLGNAIFLSLFAVVYFTLSLTLATTMVVLTAVAWWVLFFQKLKK